jgi:MFS transporter, PHS family, inorganic phosphate transporter
MNGKAEGKPDELSRAQALVQANQLEVPKASFRDFISFYGKWKNGRILLGTAGSWFLFDVAFYGLGLNSSTVLTAIGFAGGSNVYHILYNLAAGNAILTCAGAIPGYWLSVATVDTIGRKPIQIGGFCILTVLFIVWGFDFAHLSGHAQFVLYVFIQLFFNFGKLPINHMVKFILTCFRPQRNHLHCTWRVFPNPIPLYLPRYLCRFR